MREQRVEPGDQLCEAGTASDRIWVITGGLVRWTAGTTVGGGEIELRMRKGDVIGAQDAITGAERTATVVASTVTNTLELDGRGADRPCASVPADPDQRDQHPARAPVPGQRA